MVNFGQKLLVAQYGPWSSYYIDYGHLKNILDDEYNNNKKRNAENGIRKNQSHGTLGSLSTAWQSPSATIAVSPEFLWALYMQTEKVSFFVLQELGRITAQLSHCRGELLKGITEASEMVHLEEAYREAGLALLKLTRFVDLNVTGFRKILKKHDKMAHSKLSLSYLATRGSPYSSGGMAASLGLRLRSAGDDVTTLIELGNQLLQPLLQDDSIAALAAAFEAGEDDLRRYWLRYELNNNPTTPSSSISITDVKPLDKTSRSNTAPNLQLVAHDNGHAPQPSSSTTSTSHCDLMTMEILQGDGFASRQGTKMSPGQILLQIHAARGRLCQTNEFIRLLAAPMMTEGMSDEGGDEEPSSEFFRRPSKFSNLLNLLSTFLYMTNYYIVAPTSATYADKLGSDSSAASVIIGATSVSALVSTLLYSWWTSYSYKSALIFASTCSLIGNLFYAAGLPCQSMTLVMIGRLFNGFGSARSINRRYVADSYSPAERTAASAAFVTATALGMAAGPALASVLNLATEESDNVYWQAENAPGWFMFIMWSVFLACLIWKFEDPPCHKTSSREAMKQYNLGTADENISLLGNDTTQNEKEEEDQPSVSICCNVPVIITLFIYMVLKMVLEAVLSSESNLTALYFGWRGNVMGVHLAILALLILPVNFGIAYLARWYFDRELIIGLLVAMFSGCVIIYQYQPNPDDYTLWQYLIGSAVLFVCASALEAPNMSLLSKVIPRQWSKGIVNVGLLATESGTFGRVLGDALLAGMASHGLDSMLNEAFGAFGAIILATVISCFVFYKHLEPVEKDD